MVNQILSLSMEVMTKLKKEPNMSNLVERLLKKHYQENEDPKTLKIRWYQMHIMAKAQKQAEAITWDDVKDMVIE